MSTAKNWRLEILGATGLVDYATGLEQAGDWHSGLGGGITYISPTGSWLFSLLYGHGFDALRSHGRGADQVAFLFQYDFEAKALGKTRFLGRESAPGALAGPSKCSAKISSFSSATRHFGVWT